MFPADGSEERLPGEPAIEIEQRASPRFPCHHRPAWRVLGTTWGDSRTATVHNISATGIGLLCKTWIKPGTVLILTLQDRDQRSSRPMGVRVMHATEQADGLWLIGGAFTRRLSNRELEPLLADHCLRKSPD
jgi:hypothetical protein